eukprot:175099-Prymnesium_polylepis.1
MSGTDSRNGGGGHCGRRRRRRWDATAAPQARLAGAWNKHEDAAVGVAGILAAARAAGASGASV